MAHRQVACYLPWKEVFVLQAVPSWFVRVTDFREDLLRNNGQTYWVPSHVKEGRFHNWLQNARDWCAHGCEALDCHMTMTSVLLCGLIA